MITNSMKEFGRSQASCTSKSHPGIRLEKLRNTTKNLSRYSL